MMTTQYQQQSSKSRKTNAIYDDNSHRNASSSSTNNKNNAYLYPRTKQQQYNNNRNDTPEVSPNLVAGGGNGYPTTATSATIVETDPSADRHPRYLLSEARSTPIIYSNSTPSSISSSDSSDIIPTTAAVRVKNDYDNRSLCSAHSGIHQDNSSTRNQTFYFSTPLPPQRHQPYQYHGGGAPVDTPATTNSSSSDNRKKKNRFSQIFTRNKDTTTASTATSIKSALSTSGRQTIKSWRQKRINFLMKTTKQNLPDVETEAYCDVCEKYITTRIRYRNGAMVWLVSFILLLCTVVLFWVPFYVKYFKDVKHYCAGCGTFLGCHRKINSC